MNEEKKFSIDTGSILLKLDFSKEEPFVCLKHNSAGVVSNSNRDLFQIKIYEEILGSRDFVLDGQVAGLGQKGNFRDVCVSSRSRQIV